MASQADLIDGSMTTLAAKIAEISANPKPNYEVDGQRVDHADYLLNLTRTMTELIALRQKLQGPFQRITRVGSL
jgi:hypothetical protein